MGGTLAWQMALLRSDRLHMAFPVCAMYRKAAVDIIPAGHRAANPALPIRAFQGEKVPWLGGFNQHWERASALARQVGFEDISRTVSGRGPHGRPITAVLPPKVHTAAPTLTAIGHWCQDKNSG